MTNFLPSLKRSLEDEENYTDIKKLKTDSDHSPNKIPPASTLIQNPAHSQPTLSSPQNQNLLLDSKSPTTEYISVKNEIKNPSINQTPADSSFSVWSEEEETIEMGIVPGKNLQLRPVVIPCLITPPIVLNQVPHTLNCTPSLSTSSTKLSGSVSSNLNSTTSPQKTPKRNPSIRSSQTTCKGLSPTEAHTKRTLIREALEKLRKQQQDELNHLCEQQSLRLTTALVKIMQTEGSNAGLDHEKIQELLEEHQNQIRFLRAMHLTQRRRLKCGLDLIPHSTIEKKTEIFNVSLRKHSKESPTTTTTTTASTSTSSTFSTSSMITSVSGFQSSHNQVIEETTNVQISSSSEPFELETPLRFPSKLSSTENENSESELLTNYYGYWVTEKEVKHILTHGLIPSPNGADKVKWKRPDSNFLHSPEKYTEHAYIESIEKYPYVFKELKDFHKTAIVQKALKKFICYDPTAVGMHARLQYVEEQNTYYHLSGRTSASVVPIETLLEEVEKGHVLRKSWNFFPETKNRIPFKSYESACYWLRKSLQPKVSDNISIPTLEQFKEAYLKGKTQGFDRWYQELHDLIFEATNHNRKELKFFMSQLATSSPNSGLNQNTISALFNYRALSQGSRPQSGSYPYRSLVNYLAGGLGRPSGRKVRCFLENLIRPHKSNSVTVDTHMQKFVIGTGRLTLAPYEYAVIEDFYRTVAQHFNVTLPHTLQSSIWINLAGPLTYKQELLKMVRERTFTFDPTITKIAEFLNKHNEKRDSESKTNSQNESTKENETKNSNHQKQVDSEENEKIPQKVIEAWKFIHEQLKNNKTLVQKLAVKLLRERLVSIGYLNLLSTSSLLLETKNQNPSTSSEQQNSSIHSIDDKNMNYNKTVDSLNDFEQKSSQPGTVDSTTTTTTTKEKEETKTTSMLTSITERSEETKTLSLTKTNSTSWNESNSNSTISTTTTTSSNIINQMPNFNRRSQIQTDSTPPLIDDTMEEEIVAIGKLPSTSTQNMSSLSSISTQKTNSLSNSFSSDSASLQRISDSQNMNCSFTTSLQLAALESSNFLNSAFKLLSTPSSKSLLFNSSSTTQSNTFSHYPTNRTPFGLHIHSLALITQLLSSNKIPLPKLHHFKSTPTTFSSIRPLKPQLPTKRRPLSQLSSSQINSRRSKSRPSLTQCHVSSRQSSISSERSSHSLYPTPTLSSDSTLNVTLTIFAPIRVIYAEGIKNHISLRKSWIKRQNRNLLPAEAREFEEANQTLLKMTQSNSKAMDHPSDREWFERDMLWISVWMGNIWITPEIKKILENDKFNAEQDHYFRTHIHFEEAGKILKDKLQFGYFYVELREMFERLTRTQPSVTK